MAIPDWQLPPGVDRGLWEYLHASDTIAGYDEAMRTSPLAAADIAYCERAFPTPGRLLDLGCGTGRLCRHFAERGFDCTGVDLSEEMLVQARQNWTERSGHGALEPTFVQANLVDLTELPSASFDYAACLFSTLGMIRGRDHRMHAIGETHRLLKPGGRFVLHVHNRYYRGLGWKRVLREAAKSLVGPAGDIAMPQPYGGPPLTLHHFSLGEVRALLHAGGFTIRAVWAINALGEPARWWNVYGWLVLGEK